MLELETLFMLISKCYVISNFFKYGQNPKNFKENLQNLRTETEILKHS